VHVHVHALAADARARTTVTTRQGQLTAGTGAWVAAASTHDVSVAYDRGRSPCRYVGERSEASSSLASDLATEAGGRAAGWLAGIHRPRPCEKRAGASGRQRGGHCQLARRWLRRRQQIRGTRLNPGQISGAFTAHCHYWLVKDSAGQGSPSLEGARGIGGSSCRDTTEAGGSSPVRRPVSRVHTGERVLYE